MKQTKKKVFFGGYYKDACSGIGLKNNFCNKNDTASNKRKLVKT